MDNQLPPPAKTGEYLPSSSEKTTVPAQPPPAKPRSFIRWLLSPFIWVIIIMMLVFLGLTFGRQWYDSLLARWDFNKSVHPDKSEARTGIRSQVRPQVTLVYQNRDGKMVRVVADAEKYSTFVNQQAVHLENARQLLLSQTERQLHDSLTLVFDGMRERVERFADWYFSYSTTYKILWEATTSATRHTLSVEATNLADSVSYDVEKYLHQHYENIVLRPEITDPQLQKIYKNTLEMTHSGYLNVLATMQTNFQVFVAQSTTHLDAPISDKTKLVLDWHSQFNKINMGDYEKGTKGATLGALLAAGGASTGKALGSAITGKAIAGVATEGIAAKAVSASVSKGIFAKLAAPFVSKAVVVGAGGAVGTLGGPVGTVVGALGGLGVDYLISEGIELTQRADFIADINEALVTTQTEWETQMQKSLQEAINIWIDDTIQLLPRYDS